MGASSREMRHVPFSGQMAFTIACYFPIILKRATFGLVNIGKGLYQRATRKGSLRNSGRTAPFSLRGSPARCRRIIRRRCPVFESDQGE